VLAEALLGQSRSMTDDADPNPGQLVVAAVEGCLELAGTWHAGDGRPIARPVSAACWNAALHLT
jgi:hypothetical protein